MSKKCGIWATSILILSCILIGCDFQSTELDTNGAQSATPQKTEQPFAITPSDTPISQSAASVPPSISTPSPTPETAVPQVVPTISPTPTASANEEVGNTFDSPSQIYFRTNWMIFIYDFLQMEANGTYAGTTILYYSTNGNDAVFWDGETLFIDQGRTGDYTDLLEVTELKNVWWLPSNRLIVQTGTGFISHNAFILDLSTKTQTDLHPATALIEAVSASQDQWIQNVGQLELVDIEGNVTSILEDLYFVSRSGDPESDHNIVFSPDGTEIYFSGCLHEDESDCFLFSAGINENRIEEPQIILSLSDIDIKNLQVSPNGRLLAFVSQLEENLVIVEIESSSIILTIPWNEPYYPPDFIWSPYSDALAIQSVLEGEMIRVFFLTTQEWTVINSDGAFYDLVSWEK